MGIAWRGNKENASEKSELQRVCREIRVECQTRGSESFCRVWEGTSEVHSGILRRILQ